MSEYSERSQELARELRAKAERNLQSHRSARTGQLVSKNAAQAQPKTVIRERTKG